MKINVFISIGKVKSQQHLDFDISGEILTLDFGPLARGPRRVHLALMYEW